MACLSNQDTEYSRLDNRLRLRTFAGNAVECLTAVCGSSSRARNPNDSRAVAILKKAFEAIYPACLHCLR